MKRVARVTVDFLRCRNATSDFRPTGASFVANSSIDNLRNIKNSYPKTSSFSSTSRLCQSQPQSEDDVVLNLPPKPTVFRTTKTNPATFDESDVGLFYTLSPDRFKQLFQWGIEARFRNQIKAIDEAAFMIRRPFLELRDLLAATDATKMSRNYLLHGKRGAGKTMTLNTLLHYASSEGEGCFRSFPLYHYQALA